MDGTGNTSRGIEKRLPVSIFKYRQLKIRENFWKLLSGISYTAIHLLKKICNYLAMNNFDLIGQTILGRKKEAFSYVSFKCQRHIICTCNGNILGIKELFIMNRLKYIVY